MKRATLIIFFVTSVLTATAATITIAPTANALYAAVNQSQAGDVIVLADGVYNEANKISISRSLTICAAEGANPILQMKSRVEVSADLDVQGITFEAVDATEAVRMVPGAAPYKVPSSVTLW